MDKLILERGFLIDCKNKIMQGQSIRSLAEEVHIDRKTLRKNILAILSEEEKEKFQKVLSNNFRKNKKSARTIKKEQREENYKKAIKTLTLLGIAREDIEAIFESINKNEHTTMAKDTFAMKLVEIFDFIDKRNEGMNPSDKGYITKQDVIYMILRDSRFMTNDVERKLEPMCDVFDNWSPNISKGQVNRYIVEYPGIFKNSIKKLKMHLIIGDNFLVKTGNQYMSLSEYILTENPFLISENSQRFLEGVCNLRDAHMSGVIPAEELEKRIEPINLTWKKYELLEYTDDKNFKKAIKEIIRGVDKEGKRQKGEEI